MQIFMSDKNSHRLHEKGRRIEDRNRLHRVAYYREEKTREKIVKEIYGHLLDLGYRHVTNCSVKEAMEFRRQGPEYGIAVAIGEDAPTENGKIDPKKWAVFIKEM